MSAAARQVWTVTSQSRSMSARWTRCWTKLAGAARAARDDLGQPVLLGRLRVRDEVPLLGELPINHTGDSGCDRTAHGLCPGQHHHHDQLVMVHLVEGAEPA